MRYVQIPENIQLRDRSTGQVGENVSFQKFAHTCWLNDLRWEKPKTNLARLIKLLPQFDMAPGEWIELEDQDWNILKGVIDNLDGSSTLFVPLVHIQLVDFEQAVLEAPEKDPRVHPNGKSATA